MVKTLTAQVLVTSSYANAKEVSYYRVNGADASLAGASYALTDYRNAYCVRASEAAFVDPRSPLSGGTASYEWRFPAADEWVDHYTFPFDLSTWTQGGTPIITGSLSDPFGGSNASTIEDDSTGAIESVSQNSDVNLRLGERIRATIYLGKQADEGSFPEIQFRDSSLTLTYYVDINKNTGATAVRSNSGWTTVSHSLTSFNDEWWKLQVVGVSSVTNPFRLSVIPAVGTSLGTASVAATGSIKIYIDTIETSDAFKGPNKSRVFSDGGIFIEGERTNFVYNSIEAAAGTATTKVSTSLDSPDGSNTAEQYNISANGFATVSASFVPSGSDYVCSSMLMLLEGGENFKFLTRNKDNDPSSNVVSASLNVWRRYESPVVNSSTGSFDVRYFTQESNASTTNIINTWGWQIEPGLYPTSLIRTTVSSSTRTPDYVRISPEHIDPEFLSGHFRIRFIPIFDSTVETAGNTQYYIVGFDGFTAQYIRFRSTGAQWQFYVANDTGIMTFNFVQSLGGGNFDIWRAGDLMEVEANHRTGFVALRNITRNTEQTDTDVAAAGGSFPTAGDLVLGAFKGGGDPSNFFWGVIFPPEAVT